MQTEKIIDGIQRIGQELVDIKLVW
jgi:hypothetical protein